MFQVGCVVNWYWCCPSSDAFLILDCSMLLFSLFLGVEESVSWDHLICWMSTTYHSEATAKKLLRSRNSGLLVVEPWRNVSFTSTAPKGYLLCWFYIAKTSSKSMVPGNSWFLFLQTKRCCVRLRYGSLVPGASFFSPSFHSAGLLALRVLAGCFGLWRITKEDASDRHSLHSSSSQTGRRSECFFLGKKWLEELGGCSWPSPWTCPKGISFNKY